MIVNVIITDERQVAVAGNFQPVKRETYERVALALTGDSAVVAGALRAIADDIAPALAGHVRDSRTDGYFD